MEENASPGIEMPRYQCHKQVWALKIKKIESQIDGVAGIIYPEDERYAPIVAGAEYMDKHKPRAGGYYVVYDDGYKSWSPAKAFEEGYRRIK